MNFMCLKSLFITWMVYLDPTFSQLLVGFLAQLVKHCTGIAEVMRSYFQLLVQSCS